MRFRLLFVLVTLLFSSSIASLKAEPLIDQLASQALDEIASGSNSEDVIAEKTFLLTFIAETAGALQCTINSSSLQSKSIADDGLGDAGGTCGDPLLCCVEDKAKLQADLDKAQKDYDALRAQLTALETQYGVTSEVEAYLRLVVQIADLSAEKARLQGCKDKASKDRLKQIEAALSALKAQLSIVIKDLGKKLPPLPKNPSAFDKIQRTIEKMGALHRKIQELKAKLGLAACLPVPPGTPTTPVPGTPTPVVVIVTPIAVNSF